MDKAQGDCWIPTDYCALEEVEGHKGTNAFQMLSRMIECE